MLEIWKLALWKLSGVNESLGNTLLCKSLSTKDFWELETLRLVPRDPNLVNAPNIINFLFLHICLRSSLRPAHTALFNWCLCTFHRTLVALFPLFFSWETSKREGETANRTTDSVSAWDELMSLSQMTLFSDILRNLFRRTWLTGYYMVDFYFLSWNSSFLF